MKSSAIRLININRDASTRDGCEAIRQCLLQLDPSREIRITHWPEAADDGTHITVLGPNEAPFPSYPDGFSNGFLPWVCRLQGPLLGICGGHQALALAFGGKVGPVLDNPPATTSYEGMPRIDEKTQLTRVEEPDPLLVGLPIQFALQARHVDHVRQVPQTFITLAQSPDVPHQIIRHPTRPLYGIQCHPERPTHLGAGIQLLKNFLTLCHHASPARSR